MGFLTRLVPTQSRIAIITSALLAVLFITFEFTPSASHATPGSQRFEFIGDRELFTVPAGVTELTFEASGATGDWGFQNAALVNGTITVTPGEVLRVIVAGAGNPTTGTGGFPNGGSGGGVNGDLIAGGGGGSSIIYKDDADPNNWVLLVVAGGGGGKTNFGFGGAGGFIGGDGETYVNHPQIDGKGGTQTASGAHATNLAGVVNNNDGSGYLRGGDGYVGAGGGGGYYGGSGGAGDIDYNWDGQFTTYGGSGGGGSSYVNPDRIPATTTPSYTLSPTQVDGHVVFSWIAASASTTSDATTSTTPATPTTTPTTSTSTTSTTSAPTTTAAPTTTSTTPATSAPSSTTTTPPRQASWTTTPTTESDAPITGSTPFPVSGSGTVRVTDEGGFIISKKNGFVPRWRTRVYIGTFSFSLKATYTVKKKKRTYSCRFQKFGPQRVLPNSNSWRWYQPTKGCVLPKDLVTQLAKKQTTMTFSGTFARKWATSGKSVRPDGTRIGTRRINLRIGKSDTVILS
jgi:hypothetical protein